MNCYVEIIVAGFIGGFAGQAVRVLYRRIDYAIWWRREGREKFAALERDGQRLIDREQRLQRKYGERWNRE